LDKIKSFIKTTLFGGTLVVLPFVILILVFRWLYEFIADKIKPLTYILLETARLQEFVAQEFVASIVVLTIILLSFFIVGLIVKTKLGRYSFEHLELKLLTRLPFYNIIKEPILQLFGGENKLFKHVALVKLFGNDTRVTAFVTEEHDDGSYTVFVPSGPAPTAGFVYHLTGNNVQIVNYPIDKAMRTIFSVGAGSKELLNSYNYK
jgi:uncharacterized membrane protein